LELIEYLEIVYHYKSHNTKKVQKSKAYSIPAQYKAMKAKLLFLLFALGAFSGAGAADLKKPVEPPLFTWDLLWTGSWYKSVKTPEGDLPPSGDFFLGGTLYNRGNFVLGAPKLDMSFRAMATDKRVIPPEEDDGKAGFNPGLGAYHHASGSRLLYGVQSEYGLPARINNVWLRSVPFIEARQPSSRDLKAEPSAQDKSEAYLYLALPDNVLPPFDVFVSAAVDGEFDPAFGGGFGWKGPGINIRLEGFYTGKELSPRNASAWFSSAPPLPERDFNIYALSAIFNSPTVAVATDWAFSETFAWGQGVYGNFALRLGNKPWRFSLAGDGAGSRFADRNGSTAGGGFRLAAKGEHFRPRSGLLRFQGTVRSPGLGEGLNRGGLSAYFRPSAPTAASKRNDPFRVRFSRSSLSLNRDARNPEKTADSVDALAGFNFGPFSTVFSFSLHSLSCLDEDAGIFPLFGTPFFRTFDSFKLSGEMGWNPPNFRFGNLDFKSRLGYTIREGKKNLWEPSLNCSFKPGKWGRFSLKIASTDFPEKWNYTIAWRLETKGQKTTPP